MDKFVSCEDQTENRRAPRIWSIDPCNPSTDERHEYERPIAESLAMLMTGTASSPAGGARP
jgi:hypothetical protein